MAEDRPFPPSPRRRALARQAGLHAASPVVVGALACTAVVTAIAWLGPAAAAQARAWIATAARGEARLAPSDVLGAALELALPVLAVAVIAAVIAQLVQTRAAWLPRRSIAGAPTLERGGGPRVRRAGFEQASAIVVGLVVLAWLWLNAPRLAALPVDPFPGAALVAGSLATIALAWIATGVLDALLRHAAVRRALHMTEREKRDDDRLAAADPRWRDQWARVARASDASTAVAGSTLLVLGDDLAIAVAWDPVRRPVPIRTASGRGARATQLLGLARRYRIAVHRDVALAAALVGEGPVPEPAWPRLATVVAAVRRS